jgi:hypothetical protein
LYNKNIEKENKMKNIRTIVILAVTLTLLFSTVIIVTAHSNANPGVLPPTSRVQSLTYGQWLAKWWQYALELPATQNPLTNGTNECAIKRLGNVGLVVANSTLDIPIECTVPVGMKLYIEVLGAECSNLEEPPFFGGTEEELISCASGFVPQDLEASIDGVEVSNLSTYIVLSPRYDFTNPEDNILGVDPGTVGESVGSGAYLLLAPLSPGNHTIHVQGTYPDLEYTADKTFNLIVMP